MSSNPRRQGVASLLAASLLLLFCCGALRAQARPGGFAEEFVLAGDRARALEQLIPGSTPHFFYSCLLAQHEGRLDDVPPLLAEWLKLHGRGRSMIEIENRQALLRAEVDPEAAFQRLRDRLGLRFDHQRQVPGVDPELPTALDPQLLDPARLRERALQRHDGSAEGLRGRALWDYAASGGRGTWVTLTAIAERGECSP